MGLTRKRSWSSAVRMKAFELREDIRRPASCRSERAEALAQEALVDRRRDTHLMHPTWLTTRSTSAELRGRRHHRLVRVDGPQVLDDLETAVLRLGDVHIHADVVLAGTISAGPPGPSAIL